MRWYWDIFGLKPPRNKALLLVCLILPVMVQGQVWQNRAPFPGGARDDGSAAFLHPFAYYGLGMDAGFQVRRDWYSFDPVNNQWNADQPFPGRARQYATTLVWKGKIWLLGGITGSGEPLNEVWTFDGMQWDSLTPFPPPGRAGALALASGNQLLIMGGLGPDSVLSSVITFAHDVNQWQNQGYFPGGPRSLGAAFALDTTAWLGLGSDAVGQAKNDWWKVTLHPLSFTPAAPAPFSPLQHPAQAQTPWAGYILGGLDGDGHYSKACWRFDPYSAAWSAQPNLWAEGRKGMGACWSQDKLFAMAGIDSANQRKTDLWVLDAPLALEPKSSNKENTVQWLWNPYQFMETANLTGPAEQGQLKVFSAVGQLAYCISGSLPLSVPVSQLSCGVYLWQWTSGSHAYQGKFLR